jgi:hypothetical protein
MVHAGSLSETVAAIEERVFWGKTIEVRERAGAARWLAARQGLPGAYAGTFALFDAERRDGVKLFTGERVKSAAARHIMGEEAMRVLRLLRPAGAPKAALRRAAQGIRLPAVGPRGPKPRDGQVHWLWAWQAGTYCCGACSVALWRHMLAGGFDRQEERMAVGLRCLRRCRKGGGQWRVFPYWYTMLALAEMELKEAVEEMRYGMGACTRAAKRVDGNVWALRRAELAKRVLGRV